MGARDGARRAHELAREGIGLAQRDVDAQRGGNTQQFRAGQVGQVEFQGQGIGAGDQHFGRTRRQQRRQAGKEGRAVVVAGGYQGESVRLDDPGPRLGGHLQPARGAAKQRGQFAHAEEQGQLFLGQAPLIGMQHGVAAGRAQRQAALRAIAGGGAVPVLATGTAGAAKTKQLEHVRLLMIFLSARRGRHADSSRTAGPALAARGSVQRQIMPRGNCIHMPGYRVI
ncbi:hypothetical protein D3C81_639700 [compost metagenome]